MKHGQQQDTQRPVEARCERRRRALITDLRSLARDELQAIGLWDGALVDVVEDLVARDGCRVTAADR